MKIGVRATIQPGSLAGSFYPYKKDGEMILEFHPSACSVNFSDGDGSGSVRLVFPDDTSWQAFFATMAKESKNAKKRAKSNKR